MILNYRDGHPIYTQIVENYKQQIRANILQKDDRLPSVRELASALAINPNTIQRAYRELEAEGWIVSVGGKGSFVAGVPAAQKASWQELDNAVLALLRQGVGKEEILQHIQQGGDTNA